jgi:hypothetical protein
MLHARRSLIQLNQISAVWIASTQFFSLLWGNNKGKDDEAMDDAPTTITTSPFAGTLEERLAIAELHSYSPNELLPS